VSEGAKYVVAAYGVVLFALVMYVVAIGMKAGRMAREAELLARLVDRQVARAGGEHEDAEERSPAADAPDRAPLA
jgi:hypothetical protein